MQAHSLILAHNLMKQFERHLEQVHEVHNRAAEKRRAHHAADQQALAKKRGATLPQLVQTYQCSTQSSVKSYRRLRAHFFNQLPLVARLPGLTRCYDTLRPKS